MRRLLPLMALVLVGCDLSDIFGGRSPEEELERRKSRWERLALSNYDFDFRRSCGECLPESLTPVRIEVRNDVVVRVLRLSTLEPMPPGGSWPTIDSLFARNESRFREGYLLSIRYDPAYHFPSSVSGDVPVMVDDEFGETVENFVPITGSVRR
jgi:hypothetical protein